MSRYYLIHIFAILFCVGAMHGKYKQTPTGMQNVECIDCHKDHMEQKVMHMPVEDACDNCHVSSGDLHPQDGIKGFTLMDRLPDLCFYCHEEPVYQLHGHQPVEKKECLSCHDVHGSSEPVLLKSPEQELCLSCHNRTYKTDSTETVNIGQLIGPNRIAHSAITDGGCLMCHKSHGSEFRALLIEQYPEEEYVTARTENFELCFQCHDAEIINVEDTEWGTNFRNGFRNLHQLHINGNKGRNCRLCHNLHGSTQKFLMEEKVGFGNWVMNMNFVPQENGGSCLPGCHDRKSYVR